MTDLAKVKQNIKTPLTDGDLERYIGKKPEDIIKYSDLKNYPKITDLLPASKDSVIILIEDSYNSGHWVCIFRDGKNIEYYNSYGSKWDTDWRFINRMVRTILGQNTNELTRLMDDAEKDGFRTTWNKHRFQKIGSGVQTCGRHCIFRIECGKMGYDNDGYKELIDRLKKVLSEEQKKPVDADFVVARYVP